MKKVSLFISLCTLYLISCNNGYKFWDISKFNIVDTSLKDNEEIKLLYCSNGLNNNKDLDYYIQIVAVSQRTGDTVNILTLLQNGFSVDDREKIFNYFDQNNIVSKLVVVDSKKVMKVARDPKFDYIADNHYPTVIGSIGTTSK